MSASRPPLRPNHNNSSFFSGIFKRLPGRFLHSPKFLKEVREFEERLSQEIETLKPEGGEKILCLKWLASAVAVTLNIHKEAAVRIPPLDLPLLFCDEKWMNEYMDQTTRFLEVCNALSSAISEMEQGILVLRYACNTLVEAIKALSCEDACMSSECDITSEDLAAFFEENHLKPQKSFAVHVVYQRSGNSHEAPLASDEKEDILAEKSLHCHKDLLLRSRNSFAEWLNSYASSSNINSSKYISILQEMIEGLVPPKEKEIARGKSFLYALYGANATAVFVFYLLTLAFSHNDQLLSLSVQLPALVRWSASISDLIQVAKDEYRLHLCGGSHNCLTDVINLEGCVVSLLNAVDNSIKEKTWPLPADEERKLLSKVNVLNSHLDEIEKQHEQLGMKVTEMFRVIVSSRSKLLEKLGDFASEL